MTASGITSKTKIQSVTIVCQQGTTTYSLGQEVNGLEIHEIVDLGMEYPDRVYSCYLGRTADGDIVFVAENAPVDVCYYLPS